jgi:putative ergosteryl-3beta-O-L-aspartate hydrolase
VLHFALSSSCGVEGVRSRDGDRAGGVVVGVVSFYPGLDYTKTRAEKDASNAIAGEKSVIPSFLAGMYDKVYFYPPPADMAHPHISTGLAPDSLLEDALPERIDCTVSNGIIFLRRRRRSDRGLRRLGRR